MTEGAERTERGREVLRSLLYEYNEHPSERPRILQEIHRRFNREHALLIMDAAGFSRTVKAVGIVHVLALLERLERIVRPQVEAHRGASSGGRPTTCSRCSRTRATRSSASSRCSRSSGR